MARKKPQKIALPTVTMPTESTKETPESTDTIPVENSEKTLAVTAIWRIENFSFCGYDSHGPDISSSEFMLLGICGHPLRFHLTAPLPADNLCIFVVYLSQSMTLQGNSLVSLGQHSSVESISIDAEWSLLSEDGSTWITRNEPTTEYPTHPIHLSTFRVYKKNFNDSFLPNNILTIRLRVWKSGETSTKEEERIQLVTRHLKETFFKEKFFWRIRNFSALRLNSCLTATVKMRGDAFKLSLFLRGARLDEASVGFSISTERARDQVMQVTIELVSESTETYVKAAETKIRFTTAARSQTWDLPDLMPRKEILEKRAKFLEKDVLVLSCEFVFDIGSRMHSYIENWYSGSQLVKTRVNRANYKARQKHFTGTIGSVISDQGATTMVLMPKASDVRLAILERPSSQSLLLCDLKNLFTKKTLSDFELRSENRSFAVHKSILCARSAVFEEMFCGDMKAASSMDVPDLDCDTLGHFLFFLYTGTLERVQWKETMKLYDAALQYRVHSLEEECRGILINAVNLTNVTDIFEMADRAQDQELRSSAFDFIQYNFDAVVLSDEWGKFQERSVLAGKIMTEICKNRKHMKTV